jgi:glycosyltransferase involved in cell wall biosynthesis
VATGEYVAFVDSDDTVLPEMYEDMYNLAINNNLGMVCVNLHRVYDDRENKYLFPESGEVKILSAKELTTLNLRCKIAISACTTIIRRNLFEHHLFPQGIFYEDRASTFLFTASCGKGAWIDKSYYRYYYRTGSICRTQSYKKYRDFALSNLLRLEFINNSGLYSAEEMAEVAQESADSFLRKLRHILSIKSTPEDREEALSWCRKIDLIPHGTRLPLKARLIRWYIRKFVI